MDSAPAVDEGDRDEDGMLIANDRELTYNVPRSITHNAPLAGPSHPVHGHTARATNVWSGQADDVRVADYHFDDMFNRQRGTATAALGGDDVPPKKKKRTKNGPVKSWWWRWKMRTMTTTVDHHHRYNLLHFLLLHYR